jgi:hypothetical protein
MKLTTAASAAALMALAGCGGSGQSGPPTIASAAAEAGCTNPHGISTEELFAHETATCTYQGHDAEIATFANADLQKHWEEVAKEFTAIVKRGDGWTLSQS